MRRDSRCVGIGEDVKCACPLKRVAHFGIRHSKPTKSSDMVGGKGPESIWRGARTQRTPSLARGSTFVAQKLVFQRSPRHVERLFPSDEAR